MSRRRPRRVPPVPPVPPDVHDRIVATLPPLPASWTANARTTLTILGTREYNTHAAPLTPRRVVVVNDVKVLPLKSRVTA